MNYSNYSNQTSTTRTYMDWRTPMKIRSATPYVVMATGILPNLWILLALLTSRVTRARMRNKLVCGVCFLHLVYALLITPVQTLILIRLPQFDDVGCHLRTVFDNIQVMQDFIANWTLVLVIVTFIAQICDFKPHLRVSGFTSFLGTYAVLALPWVASLVLIPALRISAAESYRAFDPNFTIPSSCLNFSRDSLVIIRSLDTAVPLLVAVALVVAAVLLKRRRSARGLSSGVKVELLDRGPEIDKHLGYAAAVVVMVICDLPEAAEIFDLLVINAFQRFLLEVVAQLLSESKVFLSVLPWLLFPDIRERIKTWRPWRCARPGVDLTVVYKKETS